ncbi:family 16 glycosylhydrolase [Ruminococcus flavefaciens]|uniref:Carbohydrate binding domain-containing protein n=1 Tax=Ruminococcus flavefaciens TaxID=1265 RepID=A0A1K1LIZ5_RUMFL|nr:family 16 glycosylhydrolase [Ruminococcus flavefaciens]SFW10834.1 Carbohydrate binding domain-containing protein [Ruminococcus flavefaciens]
MKINKYLSFAAALAMLGCAVSCGDKNSSGSDTAPETAKPTEAATEAVDVPEIEGYSLLWNDEFSGSALDESKWNYEPHEPGWTNEELQEYTTSTDNVFLRDGKLVIKAIKSEKNGKDYYTSGKVTGQNKTDFSYGKVVVSAKVPEGQGLWPAIWMMPKEESYYGQWPKCGEIDIMEVLGNDVSTAYGTLHFGEPHGEIQGTWGLTGQTYADSFHEYSVEWEPGEIRWYIDGNLYNTANDWFTAVQGEDEKPYPAPFDQPFFVQMNLAVGGTWPGNPDATTDFDKAEFEIDYVRVYQKPEYDMNVKKPEKVFRQAQEDGNFIFNGDFSEAEDLTDDVNWKFLLFNGGEGSAEIKDNMIVITSQAEGTEEYSVQLVQPDLPMIKGKKYRVTFDAYADEERDIVVCVSAPSAGWIRYLQDTKLTLTTEKQSFTYDFEMKEKDDNNGRLEFNMGKRGSTATVYISNVRVEEIA